MSTYKPSDFKLEGREHTLLSKLGFQDDDRGLKRHDLGCAYVVENAARVATALKLEQAPQHASTEHVLTTASGFTVGFIDVLLEQSAAYDEDFDEDEASVIVEVKIERVTVGALTRQLKLYAEHFGTPVRRKYGRPVGLRRKSILVAAVAYDIPAVEVRALERERIVVFRLGEKFDKWCAKQTKVGAKMREL